MNKENKEFPLPSLAVRDLIQSLDLQAHPEGGFYRETWRSHLTLPQSTLPCDYTGDRVAGTAILFLLPTGHSSRWHRVKSAELWFHQAGDPLELSIAASIEPESTIDSFRSRSLFSGSSTPALVAEGTTSKWRCRIFSSCLCGGSRL